MHKQARCTDPPWTPVLPDFRWSVFSTTLKADRMRGYKPQTHPHSFLTAQLGHTLHKSSQAILAPSLRPKQPKVKCALLLLNLLSSPQFPRIQKTGSGRQTLPYSSRMSFNSCIFLFFSFRTVKHLEDELCPRFLISVFPHKGSHIQDR